MPSTEKRFFENPAVHLDDTPLPADWQEQLRSQLSREVNTLLHKVNYGPKLRGGGTDVYTGYSGVALFFLHLLEFDGSATYSVPVENGSGHVKQSALAIAKNYADTAVQLMIGTTPSNNDSAFLTSPGLGTACVAAVVDHLHGQRRAANEKIEAALVSTRRGLEHTKIPSELLYGRSGMLYAYRFLSFKCKAAIPEDVIRAAFDGIVQDGIRTAHDSAFRTLAMRLGFRSLPPLMWRFFSKCYLGAAHGVAGIVTELLHYPHLLDTPMSHYLGADDKGSEDRTVKDLVWETVQWLLPIMSPNLPSSLDSMKTDCVQWCHGSTGVCVMLEKVAEVFGPENGIEEVARASADVVWEQGLLKKGAGLCHGMGGNAYAFLHLFKLTGEEKYFNRAVRFALYASDWQARTEAGEFKHPDHIWSLFEGVSGYAYLLVDLLRVNADRTVDVGFPCQADLPDSKVRPAALPEMAPGI